MMTIAPIDGLSVSVHAAITDIAPADWDACLAGACPMVQHRHMRILEASGLVDPSTGYTPRHVVLRNAAGDIVAVAPSYLKTHSHGELGIDLGLPLAHQRLAGPYYPKLQVEVPLIPTPGPRLIVRPGADPASARHALLTALKAVAAQEDAVSIQISYLTDQDLRAARSHGFMATETNTFCWKNPGVADFEGWLATMKKNRRHTVRRERRAALERGHTFATLHGPTLPDDVAHIVYRQYCATYAAHETPTWLNQAYFDSLFEALVDVLELHVVLKGNAWIGAFFCFRTPDCLYVQHWLQEEPQRNVVFGLMFHTIERAIQLGVSCVDYGVLGQHKTLRGIDIVPVPHALWFRSDAFQQTLAHACERKTDFARKERATERLKLPFKQIDGDR
jgi:predicted N-acyltransferase